MGRNEIIDLREMSPNHWRAKYQGNYGIYTINIATDGRHRESYSCTCPSSASPCKHIDMIEEAIQERIAETEQKRGDGEVSADAILDMLSQQDLRGFVSRLIKYDEDLRNAFLLEFTYKAGRADENQYNKVIRTILADIDLHFEYYDETYPAIDGVVQWLDKAQEFAESGKPKEAVKICVACIEELSTWFEDNTENYTVEMLCEQYSERPFSILQIAADTRQIDSKALFDYFVKSLNKGTISIYYMQIYCNDLLARLAADTANPKDGKLFISMQDALLELEEDDSGGRAKRILKRKIDFYRRSGDEATAMKVISDNLQVEDFRKIVVRNKIDSAGYAEAKQLIYDFTGQPVPEKGETHKWRKLLLEIAQKENDLVLIRQMAFSFIGEHFNAEYFRIYKSAFPEDKWPAEIEGLIKRYSIDNYVYYTNQTDIGDLLEEEHLTKRLLEYMENCHSLAVLKHYSGTINKEYPAETLALFRSLLDEYAKDAKGSRSYEEIASAMKDMLKILGGDVHVKDMLAEYKAIYPGRRLMHETLGKVLSQLKP
jgi:hypothetical protein